MNNRSIVFADANRIRAKLYSGARLARLEALGTFTIHYGHPTESSEYIDRIGDASGVLTGADLPVEVLRAAKNLEIVSYIRVGAAGVIAWTRNPGASRTVPR